MPGPTRPRTTLASSPRAPADERNSSTVDKPANPCGPTRSSRTPATKPTRRSRALAAARCAAGSRFSTTQLPALIPRARGPTGANPESSPPLRTRPRTPANTAGAAAGLVATASALELAASTEEELVLPEPPHAATTAHVNTRTPTRFPRIPLPPMPVFNPIALLASLASPTPQNHGHLANPETTTKNSAPARGPAKRRTTPGC
jgi:hypothetical protein